MHNDLISHTTRNDEISLLLNAMKCIACKEITTYLSVPITSGKRLLDYWIEKKEQTKFQTGLINSDEHKNKVVLPNLIHAEEVAKKVRSSNQLLIDPSQFDDVDGWGQDDYRVFWARVIENFVSKVIFVDGWNYSNGCAYEFLIAQRFGIPKFSESGVSLKLEDGIELISMAITQMDESLMDATFLRNVFEKLIEMRDENGLATSN